MWLPSVDGVSRLHRTIRHPAPATAPVRRWRRSRPAGSAGRGSSSVTRGCRRSASSSAGVKPPSGPTSSAAGPGRRNDRRRAPVRSAATNRRRLGGPARAATRPAGAARGWPGTVRRSLCSAASIAIAWSRARLTRCGVGALGEDRAAARQTPSSVAFCTTRSVASRLSSAKTSHRSGSGACGAQLAFDAEAGGRRAAALRCARSIRRRVPLNSTTASPDRAPHDGAEVVRLRRRSRRSRPRRQAGR